MKEVLDPNNDQHNCWQRVEDLIRSFGFVIETNEFLNKVDKLDSPSIRVVPLRGFSKLINFAESEKNECPTIYIKFCDCKKKYEKSFKENLLNHRWLQYVDSSIWRYLCEMNIVTDSLGDKKISEEDEARLNEILKSIQENFSKGLYDLAIAREYNDLQCRILKESYLKKYVGKDGEHTHVSPFLFHSESEMKRRLFSYRQFFIGKKWNILLLDDRSRNSNDSSEGKSLQKVKEDGKTLCESGIFQNEVINNRISLLCDQLKIPNPFTVDCVQTIKDAEDVLKMDKRYDIILLDYKLDKDLDGRDTYGYGLLTDIRKNINELQHHAGPNGKFFFMFTSAYPTAVQERLRCEDLSTSEKYWFIGRGANPTNTPYLFLYLLCQLMRVRYETLTEHAEQLLRKLKENEADVKNAEIDNYTSMSQFLTLLYQEGNERNNCVVGFNAFLNLRRVYNTVKYDIDEKEPDKGSPLINSLFPDVVVCTNSFWEHLQNLVYLTAYGTIRQWPEMWEDYTFVKQKLEAAEKLCKERINGEPASVLIRNYILKLKESMS